jgi:two-component system catabolic regulation response regulator CreB
MRRLLLVEDDADASSFIKYVLEQEQFEVQVAQTAGEARAALAGRPADLVVIDHGLPDGDGIELCREMRGRPGMARTPVMFLTALKTPADIDDGFAAGADDYLAKPFSFIEFLARVKALLRRDPGSGEYLGEPDGAPSGDATSPACRRPPGRSRRPCR